MINKKMKFITMILAVALSLAICIPAMAIGINGPSDSVSYSIAQGKSEWCGHCNDKFWETKNQNELKWQTSITSSGTRSIVAKLYKYNWSVIVPDTLIDQESLTGTTYDFFTYNFTPDANVSYYAKITTTSPQGVNGKTALRYA